MHAKTCLPNTPPEEELLLPFECRVMTGDWKEYLKTKRQCWCATIQRFWDLWKFFTQIDEIFRREIDDLHHNPEADKAWALLLFIKAHQGIRIAAEVAFSTHVSQAYDLARSAIDVAVIAHKISREPKLVEVFMRRDEGKVHMEAFNDAFIRNKKVNLFPDQYPFMKTLHQIYSRFSDWGTHPSIYSMAHHFDRSEDTEKITFTIKYTEGDEKKIGPIIYDVIVAFYGIEQAFHDAFSYRLKLDPELQKQRMQIDTDRERIARDLIKRFRIRDPNIIIPRN